MKRPATSPTWSSRLVKLFFILLILPSLARCPVFVLFFCCASCWCFLNFILCCHVSVACFDFARVAESPQPPPRVSRHRMQPSPSQDSSSEWRSFLFCFFFASFPSIFFSFLTINQKCLPASFFSAWFPISTSSLFHLILYSIMIFQPLGKTPWFIDRRDKKKVEWIMEKKVLTFVGRRKRDATTFSRVGFAWWAISLEWNEVNSSAKFLAWPTHDSFFSSRCLSARKF